MTSEKEKMALQDLQERRVLLGTAGFTLLGILFMLIAISADYWYLLHIPGGQYRNSTKSYVINHHAGLWRICRKELDNRTYPHIRRDYCTMIKLFPNSRTIDKDPEIDGVIVNFSRTETAFAVIALLLMMMGLVFTFYAIREPRYMFKRVAAAIHIITAICILVCAEVLSQSVAYEEINLPARHPEGSYYRYGFCFYLAWITFAIFVLAGIVFIWFSRKRKGFKAYNEEEALENEPVHLGRI